MARLLGTSLALCLAVICTAVADSSEDRRAVPGDWQRTVERTIREREYCITWQDGTSLPDCPAAYHAPNRAHNIRTFFTPSGFRAIPRGTRPGDAPPWEWGLSFVGASRIGWHGLAEGEAVANPADLPTAWLRQTVPPPLCVDGNRVEYDHGDVIEWYVNDERGLEQGFTILEKPSAVGPKPSANGHGRSAAGAPPSAFRTPQSEIRLILAVTGNVTASVSSDGQSVDFLAPGGALAIHFGELHALDATGRALPTRFEASGQCSVKSGQPKGPQASSPRPQALAIVINDTGAIYPLTIDPIATSPAWTTEANQANAWFGLSVAGAGDVNGDGFSDVIVGAPLYDCGQTDEGAAFLFFGSPAGLSLVPAWQGEGNQPHFDLGSYGWSVAAAGDVNGDGFGDVIIGDVRHINGNLHEGRALVYHGSAAGLSTSPAWTAEGGVDFLQLGSAVSTAGDVNADGFSDVIIGAVPDNNSVIGPGMVLAYHGSAAGLSSSPQWQIFGTQSGQALGASVALAGDVNGDGFSDVLVGEPGFTHDLAQEGGARLYTGSAQGLSLGAAWLIEGNQSGANLGRTVAGAGDVNGDGYADVLVGAPLYSNGQTLEGLAMLFFGSAAGPATLPQWTSEGNQIAAIWGWSVAGIGDTNGDGYADIVVGSQLFNNGQNDEGRAAVFLGSATGLASTPGWTGEGDQEQARYGYSVAGAGDVNGDGFADLLIGSYWFDHGEIDEGRAYAYYGSPQGLAALPAWSAESNQAGADWGLSVAGAGDVNADGFADVIVGSPRYDNGSVDEGAAFLFLGSASGLGPIAAWSVDSNQPLSQFGASVAGAGDVNGDGFDDVIIGAPNFNNVPNLSKEGRAWLYLGSPTGPGATADWIRGTNRAFSLFGARVAPAGDVNSDGLADVIIGAPGFSNGQANEGRAFVYHGTPIGLSLAPQWGVESDQADADLGRCVASAGDVNRDGYSDVLVAAPRFDNGQADEGRVWLYLGGDHGVRNTPAWMIESDQVDARLGEALSCAGDVNGDGFSDAAIAAAKFDGMFTDEGAVFIHHGAGAGLMPAPARTLTGGQPGAEFGSTVASAGDVNGDGICELIVGARLHDYSKLRMDEGRVAVYEGTPDGLPMTPAWTFECNQAMAQLGASVAGPGDVNGDGYSDVIVAAPFFDNAEMDEGRLWMFYGNGGPGRPTFAAQRRPIDGSRISPRGRSSSSTLFQLGAPGRTPIGRARVRLEYEVKPLRMPFDGLSLRRSSAFVDSGVAGTLLMETDRSPLTTQVLHWRLRILYDPVTSPVQRFSRWLSPPDSGWNEADMRLAPPTRSSVRDGSGKP